MAHRVNLASAVFGTLAVLAVYAAGYLCTRRAVPAAAGALAFRLGAALGAGLCVTNRMTSAPIVPASLIFVGLVRWRKLLEWRLTLKDAGVFSLSLSPCLYLSLRAAMDPAFEGNNPTTLDRFWYAFSGGNLTGTFFPFGPAELPGGCFSTGGISRTTSPASRRRRRPPGGLASTFWTRVSWAPRSSEKPDSTSSGLRRTSSTRWSETGGDTEDFSGD